MTTSLFRVILTIVLLKSFQVSAQQKETVYSLVKERKQPEWYTVQAGLWKKETQKSPKNTDAWLNYFTASRMAKIYGLGVDQDSMDNLVKAASSVIPNTFEYHYIAYWNSGLRLEDKHVNHLYEAKRLGPDRVELHDDLITYYEVNRFTDSAKQVAKSWFTSNDISSGLYNWNYNMLMSTDENAILLTAGDNDTYPSWVLQYAKELRTDVSVLNIYLLRINSYREGVFKELSIPTFEYDDKSFEDMQSFSKDIVDHIRKHSKRPLYFAVSCPATMYEHIKSDVYNVGMAYRYSASSFDNIAVMKRNYEQRYRLDYLKEDMYTDVSQGVVDHANSNYLLSLITLLNHYEESGDQKAEEIEQIIRRIATKTGNSDRVEELLGNTKTIQVTGLFNKPKDIEDQFVHISDSFYAGATEVTNGLYQMFLTDLLNQKRYDLLAIAKNEKVNWVNETQLSSEDNGGLYANGSPDDENAPVVNISFEAAQLFCEWLTTNYNAMSHKKKQFDSVVIRLPSEEEWERIAGGQEGAKDYPWYGKYLRNSKGCYLTNIRTTVASGTDKGKLDNQDGAYFPVHVTSYFPNDFGLYNVVGNVAEMTSKKGVAKGGSWDTPASKASISYSEKYEGASSRIGFRVIMIVN